MLYEKQTDPALGRAIRDLQDDWSFHSTANRYERANLRDAARDYALQVGKSKEMAMQEAELEGKGYSTWVKTRKDNNFADFKPVLEEILSLRKEVVRATRPNMDVYDGCIDMFERGMTVRFTMPVCVSNTVQEAGLIVLDFLFSPLCRLSDWMRFSAL